MKFKFTWTIIQDVRRPTLSGPQTRPKSGEGPSFDAIKITIAKNNQLPFKGIVYKKWGRGNGFSILPNF